MISSARLTAFTVLNLVAEGGFASDLLLTHAAELSSRDAGLASELVFGSLRHQSQLDYVIGQLAGREVAKMDEAVRIALRLGAYQLLYLDRVPRHAAVSESVELVKRARKHSAAGLVNAVLRRVVKPLPAWPDRARTLATPDWLLRRWDAQFGPAGATKIATAFLQPPEVFLRVPPGAEPSPSLQLEPTPVEGCFRLLSGEPNGLRQQDIGSQSIVPLLELTPGVRLLDLCAAPGNKTAQALEAGVRAIACDVSPGRIRHLAQTLPCPVVRLDASQELPFATRFERILIDAPCTGTGTIGRNPEIKWRLTAARIGEMAALQKAILMQAVTALAPGGRLVYATCSLEREENEEVVAHVLERNPHLVLDRQMRRLPGVDAGDGFHAAVLTSSLVING